MSRIDEPTGMPATADEDDVEGNGLREVTAVAAVTAAVIIGGAGAASATSTGVVTSTTSTTSWAVDAAIDDAEDATITPPIVGGLSVYHLQRQAIGEDTGRNGGR